VKKELISQYPAITLTSSLAYGLAPSTTFANYSLSIAPLYLFFFKHKFQINYFFFFSTFWNVKNFNYKILNVSVKPKISRKRTRLLHKALRARKVLLNGTRSKNVLTISGTLQPQLAFCDDTSTSGWPLRGAPFTYLNRFILNSKTYNRFFLSKMKKKILTGNYSYNSKVNFSRKKGQRLPIPRNPVGESFSPKPYLFFLDGVRASSHKPVLLFRALKHLSFRYFTPPKNKPKISYLNLRKKLLSAKKTLPFLFKQRKRKSFNARKSLKRLKGFFFKGKLPTLYTRRALFNRLFLNSLFKKGKKRSSLYEATLLRSVVLSPRSFLPKSLFRRLLWTSFNKKVKVRFRKIFLKRTLHLPKPKHSSLVFHKRRVRPFLIYSLLKKFFTLTKLQAYSKSYKYQTPNRFFFFWTSFFQPTYSRRVNLRKFRYTIKPQLLKSFSFGFYGYLYVTPLHEVFSKKGILGIVVSLYSFTFFHDIKTFFLRNFKPSINFMGKSLTNPLFDWKPLDSTSYLVGTQSLSPFPHTEELSPCPPNWISASRPLPPFGLQKVRRIRFKPGYSRIWRYARSSLKFLWSLSFKYQHRLTSFLAKFQRLNKMKMARCYELKAHYVLSHSYFSPDFLLGKSFFSHSLVFLNGRLCSNPDLVLVVNDVIQLIVSYKYYVIQRWLVIFKKKKIFRLTKFMFTKKNKMFAGGSTLLTTRFPKWLLDIIFFKSDIPKYLEVDFFTLSIFLVYEPFFVNDFNPLTWKLYKFNVLNLYNWKYIN